MIIPKRLQIETVFGCNAKCVMCPVHLPSFRKRGVMSGELFRKIIDSLEPYKEKIAMVDLFGLGEPLLDRAIHDKVAYAKQRGLRNVAIATNADLLTESSTADLIHAGLDTIIFSIDGMNKHTHESIRRNTNYERCVANALRMISMRNSLRGKMKVVMRYIMQVSNAGEFGDFKEYWGQKLDRIRGDKIIGYNIHTWGGEIDIGRKEEGMGNSAPCHHLFDRLVILSDGTVALCCSDMHSCRHLLGDVTKDSPIGIFNNAVIREIRKLHKSGRRNEMEICRKCSILSSEKQKDII